MKPREFVKPFRVADGTNFRLKDFDPAETLGLKSKEHAQETLERGIARLSELQEKLYAQDRWAVLVILQAMDAAGKDSTIKHVMSGVNPQGCQVTSFKTPSVEDLQHDFFWRATRFLPERGRIGIFNRSYYEEVLIVRVHPEILANEKMPDHLVSGKIWQERFADITAYESYLSRNGIAILKFFLNLSRKEQKKTISGPAGRTGKELEIFRIRCPGAAALGRIHGRLRGHDPEHEHKERALVCGSGRPQVVLPPRGRGGSHRSHGGTRSVVSQGGRGKTQGLGKSALCPAARIVILESPAGPGQNARRSPI